MFVSAAFGSRAAAASAASPCSSSSPIVPTVGRASCSRSIGAFDNGVFCGVGAVQFASRFLHGESRLYALANIHGWGGEKTRAESR